MRTTLRVERHEGEDFFLLPGTFVTKELRFDQLKPSDLSFFDLKVIRNGTLFDVGVSHNSSFDGFHLIYPRRRMDLSELRARYFSAEDLITCEIDTEVLRARVVARYRALMPTPPLLRFPE